MKTIKFIGDPNDNFHGAEDINFFGLWLKKGIAKTCIDPDVLEHAEASSHFVVRDVKNRKVKADDKNGE